MNKDYSITAKLLFSFILLSVVSILFIFIYFLIHSKISGINFNIYSVSISFLQSLLLYIGIFSYILVLSVYFSFYNSGYSPTLVISKVVTYPICAILFLVIVYGFLTMIISSAVLREIESYSVLQEYVKYLDYENKLKIDSYEASQKALNAGNVSLAYEYATDALFYGPEDVNTLILLKNINEEKYRQYRQTHAKEVSNINRYITLGTRAYSLSNYNEASRYFNNILNIDKTNPLALYYLNKISIIQNGKPKYIGKTTEELETYGRLARAIELYEEGNLWGAYDIISDLYAKFPSQMEVKNYYLIIKESIGTYNFFIKDASRIKKIYVEDMPLPEMSSYSVLIQNGFNLMLDDNTLLHASSSVFFRGSFYMFDVALISINSDFEILNYSIFKYGKLVDAFTNSSTSSRSIILKGKYNRITRSYDRNDLDENRIYVNINNSTVYALKNYNKLFLNYRSVKELLTWHYEFPRFGYSDVNVDGMLLKKLLSPIYLFLISLIIAYYSFRYRSSVINKRLHIYHRLAGFIGTILVTLIAISVFNFFVNLASSMLPISIGAIIMTLLAVFTIFVYILQMSRISKDVR